jgi:hypothetical protein
MPIAYTNILLSLLWHATKKGNGEIITKMPSVLHDLKN